MSTVSTPQDDVRALYEELRVGASLAVRFHSALAAHAGVNITDITCLGALDKNGPMTPGELAEHTGLTRGGAITAVVDRLERAGFVQRRRDSRDRRKVIVELLRDGAYARLAEALDSLGHAYADVIGDHTEEERGLLLEFNRRVNARLQERISELQERA
ncbi:MarR family transcriptional regulator [Nocardiopsis sp. TSRI0078]|uniref:MarR family winged helix-turn-helix transcriptional regulator n=1 Tax=unclassified Nocardiopsis TaxID=2649073 RepID=UPI00093987CF|nr:MarR family transcriptional regulator [Nocardiopsis sp. TSRI0078]OKI15676.1 MarR family transcriptional regulator [Nocardiopsis sp. TSRI0078]